MDILVKIILVLFAMGVASITTWYFISKKQIKNDKTMSASKRMDALEVIKDKYYNQIMTCVESSIKVIRESPDDYKNKDEYREAVIQLALKEIKIFIENNGLLGHKVELDPVMDYAFRRTIEYTISYFENREEANTDSIKNFEQIDTSDKDNVSGTINEFYED